MRTPQVYSIEARRYDAAAYAAEAKRNAATLGELARMFVSRGEAAKAGMHAEAAAAYANSALDMIAAEQAGAL